MKRTYIEEIAAIKANIEEIKADRKEAWDQGRRSDYNLLTKDIRELNERIHAIEKAYNGTEDDPIVMEIFKRYEKRAGFNDFYTPSNLIYDIEKIIEYDPSFKTIADEDDNSFVIGMINALANLREREREE